MFDFASRETYSRWLGKTCAKQSMQGASRAGLCRLANTAPQVAALDRLVQDGFKRADCFIWISYYENRLLVRFYQ